MKTAVLFGITLLAATPALAQTSPAASVKPSRNVTLTGCVGAGADAKSIVLSNALIVPGTAQPGQIDQTPSPVPSPVSSEATEPVVPPMPPASAAQAVPPASPAQAVPPASAAQAPSPVGTSGTRVSTPAATGTSGIVTGTAPAGSSASTLTGYHLSGADMKQWLGQRVQVIGTFVPAAPAASPSVATTGAPAALPLPEFKVQTVVPASGPCPK